MNLFRMEMRRNFRTLIIWAAVCGALTLLLTMLYPAMLSSDMLALMNAKLASLPKELVDMFNLSGEDIRQLPQFFAYFFQFVMMAACVYGATLGLSVISREESEGTIEFLYAKPLRRSQIVTGKLLSAAATFAIYFAVVTIGGVIGCMAVKPEALDTMALLTSVKAVMVGGFIAGITYMFVGLALSVLLRRSKHAASLASALFFGTFIVGSIPPDHRRAGLSEMALTDQLHDARRGGDERPERLSCADPAGGDGRDGGAHLFRLQQARPDGITQKAPWHTGPSSRRNKIYHMSEEAE